MTTAEPDRAFGPGEGPEALCVSIRRGDREVAVAVPGDRPLKIGRSRQCDVVLDDPAVSRVHAVLTLARGEAVLLDQKSQNGIWVEGQRVPQVTLVPGVAIAMGPFRLIPESRVLAPSVVPELTGEETVVLSRARTAAIPAQPQPLRPPPVAPAVHPQPLTQAGAARRVESASPAATAGRVRSAGGSEIATRLVAGLGYQARRAAERVRGDARLRMATLAVAGLVVLGLVALVGMRTLSQWRSGGSSAPPSPARVEPPLVQQLGGAPAGGEVPARETAGTTGLAPAGSRAAAPPAAAPETAGAAMAPAGTAAPVPEKVAPKEAPAAGSPAARTPGTLPPRDFIPATRRPRESTRAWQQRSRALTARYKEGQGALEAGEPERAVEILSAIQAEDPGFADTAGLLGRARDEARRRVSRQAEAAFDEAVQLEREGNLSGALAGYERAKQLDPELGRVDQAIATLLARMREEAEAVMRRARAEDAFGRVGAAIPLYRRVVTLLPEGDPLRAEAQQRLDKLQGIGRP